MATLTVGAGKTYSTISAAITAANAAGGDVVEVYAQSVTGVSGYNENVTISKGLHLTAKSPGIKVGGLLNATATTGTVEVNGFTFLDDNWNWTSLWQPSVNCVIHHCVIYLSNLNFNPSAGVTTFHNCLIVYFSNIFIFTYDANSNCNLYNNTLISMRTASDHTIIGGNAGATCNYYNNLSQGVFAVGVPMAGPTFNKDYNIYNKLPTSAGANEVAKNAVDSGVAAFQNTSPQYANYDYRTISSKEIAGTKTANGVDLTALYTTDIDGRTRTTYAIGCSEGYSTAVADYPAVTNVRNAIVFDNGAKTGTAHIPTAANVRLGTATDATTGTLAVPAAGNVRLGTAVDATTGTLIVPSAADVRNGTGVDAGTGTAHIPAAGNVRLGTATDATTGTLAVPIAGNVRFGTAVDATTGTAYIPGAADVRFGTAVDATTGTAHIPTADDVRLAVAVDATVGNVTLPTEANVRLSVTYDTNLSRTGTFAGGGTPPTVPTITVADHADGSGATVTVSGADTGTTNTVYYRLYSAAAWTAGSFRTGNGTISQFVDVVGLHWFVVTSTTSGGTSISSPVSCLVTSGTESVMQQILTAVAGVVNNAALTDSAGAAVSAAVEMPPLFENVNTTCVKVFPDNDDLMPDHSGCNFAKYRVNVVLCERSRTTAEQNGDMKLRQQLQDMFVGSRLAGLPTLYCTEAVASSVYDYDALKEKFVFIAPLTIEFQANRAKI